MLRGFCGLTTTAYSLTLFLLFTAVISAQQESQNSSPEQAPPLAIPSVTPPKALLHDAYEFQLPSKGGTPPLSWRIENGELPPGLELDEDTGIISGKPSHTGEFNFRIAITDSGQPPQSKSRDFVVVVVAPLSIEWDRPPELTDDGIIGSVRVANATNDSYDLTVVIVAVNEIGKAFALGYQHFALAKDTPPVIQFGSSLPPGEYIVHADAVAEIAPKDLIRRARLQTPEPLVKK